MSRTITKVQYANNLVEIDYEIGEEEKRKDEITLLSADPPRPEFKKALSAIATDICHEVLGVPTGWANNMTVLAVKMGAEAGSVTVSHTISKPVKEKRTLKITTPPVSEKGFSASAWKRIVGVLDEAERYLNGERAQLELMPATEGAKKSAKAAAHSTSPAMPEGRLIGQSLQLPAKDGER